MEQNNRTAQSITRPTAPSTATKSFAPQQPTQNKPAQSAYIDREVLISIKNLHKAYGKKQVLKGLNLEVYKGELFGF